MAVESGGCRDETNENKKYIRWVYVSVLSGYTLAESRLTMICGTYNMVYLMLTFMKDDFGLIEVWRCIEYLCS